MSSKTTNNMSSKKTTNKSTRIASCKSTNDSKFNLLYLSDDETTTKNNIDIKKLTVNTNIKFERRIDEPTTPYKKGMRWADYESEEENVGR